MLDVTLTGRCDARAPRCGHAAAAAGSDRQHASVLAGAPRSARPTTRRPRPASGSHRCAALKVRPPGPRECVAPSLAMHENLEKVMDATRSTRWSAGSLRSQRHAREVANVIVFSRPTCRPTSREVISVSSQHPERQAARHGRTTRRQVISSDLHGGRMQARLGSCSTSRPSRFRCERDGERSAC